jgi:hypothetical protein
MFVAFGDNTKTESTLLRCAGCEDYEQESVIDA